MSPFVHCLLTIADRLRLARPAIRPIPSEFSVAGVVDTFSVSQIRANILTTRSCHFKPF